MTKLKRFKIRILLIVSVIIITAVSFYFVSPAFTEKSTAYAIGDLIVNWGVPEGNPIFVVNNIAPGQSQNRNVTVSNGALSMRPVGARGIHVTETGSLGSVLQITISVGGVDIYGGTTGTKTVTQFITASSGPDGIFLTNLNPTQTKTINFKVDFPQSAGNEYQGKNIVFDLKIGISIDLPAECDNINLLPTPIIGTSKAESINGTSGNDLIMGLEGADHINGNGGDDCIIGGPGADAINGNEGNDVIFEGEGADTIHGNNGSDIISGGTGADSIYGDNGQDQLFGNEDSDSLSGGNDNDTLIGGSSIDGANGGQGTDSCSAESKSNCEIPI